ncbi:hypothetical protein [Curtobacterium sp. UCD-KPL2560]|uniref:hypothetical protein n=1 Tax=Curtobacterium sp. UCD-KPL2560 TaxID=1885315 RepID=UPI0008256476|nr:hypothetical protein [Curtobacterium sp. UCD-KPL2560]
MRPWRNRKPPAPHPEEIDPRVPKLADWGRNGIIGTIGSGPAAGSTVVAHPHWTAAGFDWYEVEVWDGPEEIEWFTDDRVPGQEGGLIDALTREVDVLWWTDSERIDALWATHWDRT